MNNKFLRFLRCFIITFIAIVAFCTTTFFIVQAMGKKSLYNQTKGQKTNLEELADKIEATAETMDVIAYETGENEEENWEEGDILYQDIHYRYNEEILTFLFMGIDKMGKVRVLKDGIKGGQSDAIFLLVLDPKMKEVSVISVNRNTMTDVDVYDKRGEFVGTTKAQLALQHGYGDGGKISCERSVKAVSNFFYGVPIHGYCAINMGAITRINDAVGGVSLIALDDVPSINVRKGQEITLKGKRAYAYLHDRDVTSFGSAGGRLERQKQYIDLYADKAIAQMKEDISFPVKLYNTIDDYMVTDVSADEVSYLSTQILDYHLEDTRMLSLQGETILNEKLEEFHADDRALYELILDVFYYEVED